MAEVRLGAVRIGFEWSAEVKFPVGFLGATESIRMKFRRYTGDLNPIQLLDEKVDGETIDLSLTAAQTADMVPSTYIGEAVVYDTADPGFDQIPLTNNRYLIDCDYSPSE